MSNYTQKDVHAKFSKALSHAFAECQKKGINVNDFQWFKVEKKSDAKKQRRKKRAA
ncbi:hypothetical protein [Thiomicrorhabdus sp.]|uniref:hypothetical protein n=1 Tax=Thiomicrorhabdus sp. TaxID=2039724 RepID=UPI002AA69488|nr:hypothetical protein [Thiomicrorhabdus sp.]